MQDTPEKVLYGKVFHPNTSPRVIQSEFTFFIQALQRTNHYIHIKTRFHNLSKNTKKFQFTRVTLVNNRGTRVKPIKVIGTNWKFNENGVTQEKSLPNETTDLNFLFPTLNLFSNDSYKFYITLNNKNYLITI